MIYYVDTAGNVLGGTASNDLNGITKLADGAVWVVQIDDATVASTTNNNSQGAVKIINILSGEPNIYGIPTATGTLQFTPTTAAELLSAAQTAKTAQINASFYNAIGTFKSSATGVSKTYLADAQSMAFLNAEYAYVRSSDYQGETINWLTVEDGTRIPHTGAQIAQVFLDGRAWVKAQADHRDFLLSQVNSATTVDAVNAITW